MTDQELRALVRDAVQRHLGARPPAPPTPSFAAPSEGPHPSHGVYIRLVNTSEACVIEPSARCEHCQYCRSHGH